MLNLKLLLIFNLDAEGDTTFEEKMLRKKTDHMRQPLEYSSTVADDPTTC